MMVGSELADTADWEGNGVTVQGMGMRNGVNGIGEPHVGLISSSESRTMTASVSTLHSDMKVGGFIASPDVAHRAAGRMCFGVSLPGTGHTEYVFQICANGKTWKVSRRFSEFLDLDTKLRQMFGKPTRPFPPLPEKKMIGSSSSETVSERQEKLTAYLQAVLENGILSSTAEVQRFIDMETDAPPVPSVFRSNVPRGTPMPP